MDIVFEERPSDSPYVETVTHGWTTRSGSTIRPSECHWHMVFVRVKGSAIPIVTGPLRTSGIVHYGEGAEILWIKFKLGTYLPHLPIRSLLDSETPLPQAAGKTSFWLKGSAWQFPDHENVETFVSRLIREDILIRDPLVNAVLSDHALSGQALSGQAPAIPPRTMRHRFLQATGLTQGHIRQAERAQQAAALLRQGTSILDTVFEAGYYDQPHLTRSLKQFIGYTPAQIVQMTQVEARAEASA